MKVLSIEVGILTLLISRITKLGNSSLFQWIIFIFLVVNILEAVARDFVAGGIANYFNALAGILLIVTLDRINTIHIDVKDEYNDLSWGSMTMSWIIGYTLWNWVFVYLNYGDQSAVYHLAVLASALVIAFIDRERWLQARVFTLGTYFMIFHTIPHLNPDQLAFAYNETFGLLVATASLGFMAVYAILHYKLLLINR
jgi:hypothetical protein